MGVGALGEFFCIFARQVFGEIFGTFVWRYKWLAPKCRKAFSAENRNSYRVTERMNVELSPKRAKSGNMATAFHSTSPQFNETWQHNSWIQKYTPRKTPYHICCLRICSCSIHSNYSWAREDTHSVPLFMYFRANTVTYFYFPYLNTNFNNACLRRTTHSFWLTYSIQHQ